MKERRQTRDGVRQGQSERIVRTLERCREARAWIRLVDQCRFFRASKRPVGARSRSNWTAEACPSEYSPRPRRLDEGQLGNLDVLLLRQQFCAALIEPALHIPEGDLFA